MALSTYSVDTAIAALKKDGFFCIQDPAIAVAITTTDAKKAQFLSSSPLALEFYRLNVFLNQRIRSILETVFDWCALGDYRRIDEDPGHIFQLRKGGTKADVLTVQLWNKESEATYYAGSHQVSPEVLESVRAANRMFEVARARLDRAGCEARAVSFPNGGLVIMDSRLSFGMNRGSPVSISFASSYQLQNWPRLTRPKSSSAALVASIQDERIGAYFETDKVDS